MEEFATVKHPVLLTSADVKHPPACNEGHGSTHQQIETEMTKRYHVESEFGIPNHVYIQGIKPKESSIHLCGNQYKFESFLTINKGMLD